MASNLYPDADLKREPSLEELFAEPIVQLVMQRDGVHGHALHEEIVRLLSTFVKPAG